MSSSNASPVLSAAIDALIAGNDKAIIAIPAITPVAIPMPIFFPSNGSPDDAHPMSDDNAPNAAPPPSAATTPVTKSNTILLILFD